MISIIVSSYKEQDFKRFEESVKTTIGDEVFEIIQIWNPGIMGICEAYNKGAAKAKYNYLCFVHEDVEFKTNNWGRKFIDHLEPENIGAIGVAGANYKSVYPSSWSQISTTKAINIIQYYKDSNKPKVHHFINPDNVLQFEAVVLDGVFIGTKRNVWVSHNFDSKCFRGFHGYDMDFTLNVSQSKTVIVVFDILLAHYSQGFLNNSWMKSAFTVSNKWFRYLPKSIPDLSKKKMLDYEKSVYSNLSKKITRFSKFWFKLMIFNFNKALKR